MGHQAGVHQVTSYEHWGALQPTDEHGVSVPFAHWAQSEAAKSEEDKTHTFKTVDGASGYLVDAPYVEPPTWRQVLESRAPSKTDVDP